MIDNYEDLIELNATAMLASLFSKRVITLIEKDIILQTKPLEREKMQYLLDKIIIPSLQAGVVQKFELFLEVMKGSEDIAINILAQKLGMLNSVWVLFTSCRHTCRCLVLVSEEFCFSFNL